MQAMNATLVLMLNKNGALMLVCDLASKKQWSGGKSTTPQSKETLKWKILLMQKPQNLKISLLKIKLNAFKLKNAMTKTKPLCSVA
jgi:hypothetical protein